VGGLRPELVEDRSQRADARRKGIAVALYDVVKLVDKSGRFFVGKVKCHSGVDMGSLSLVPK
jgi:hypothetical protein